MSDQGDYKRRWTSLATAGVLYSSICWLLLQEARWADFCGGVLIPLLVAAVALTRADWTHREDPRRNRRRVL
jgi:hypothetical protein